MLLVALNIIYFTGCCLWSAHCHWSTLVIVNKCPGVVGVGHFISVKALLLGVGEVVCALNLLPFLCQSVTIVKFCIPGYSGPGKARSTEVRLMRGKISHTKIQNNFFAAGWPKIILNPVSYPRVVQHVIQWIKMIPLVKKVKENFLFFQTSSIYVNDWHVLHSILVEFSR